MKRPKGLTLEGAQNPEYVSKVTMGPDELEPLTVIHIFTSFLIMPIFKTQDLTLN